MTTKRNRGHLPIKGAVREKKTDGKSRAQHVREIQSWGATNERHGTRIKRSIGARENSNYPTEGDKRREKYILRIHTQPRPICLHELPQDVLGRLVDIGATRIFWEVSFQRDLSRRNISISKAT